MKSIAEHVARNGRPEITIGDITIRDLEDGTFWLERSSGEGQQVKYDKLEKLIESFYNQEF